MNKFKMRVKKRLTDELARIKSFSSDFYKGEREGINFALYAIDSIDEPEKPVVPQYVADWYEKNEYSLERNIYTLCIRSYQRELPKEEFSKWFDDVRNKAIETLVKMKLYGYEVEKEKLYTAKLKSTDEYLDYDKDYKEIRHFKVPDDVANKVEGYHFTEDELKKYNAWKNEAYEVTEVNNDN